MYFTGFFIWRKHFVFASCNYLNTLNFVVSFSPSFEVTHFRESYKHSFISIALSINMIRIFSVNNANKLRNTFDSMRCKCFVRKSIWLFEIRNENSLASQSNEQQTLPLKLFSSQLQTSLANQFELISHIFVGFDFAIQIDIIS